MHKGRKKCAGLGRTAWCAAALCLLLPACGGEGPADSDGPKTAESVPAEPSEHGAVRWLAEEGHCAFPVGEYWVTAERRAPQDAAEGGEAGNPELPEALDSVVTLSVWDPADLSAPIQTMTKPSSVFGRYEVTDANFDGEEDFGWMYFIGNQPAYWYYWIWNEKKERFVEEPAFAEISCPVFDDLTQTVSGWARSSAAGTGVTTLHRWEDGRLIWVRRITAENDPGFTAVTLAVEEPVNGVLAEVFRRDYPMDEDGWIRERSRWEDSACSGEA